LFALVDQLLFDTMQHTLILGMALLGLMACCCEAYPPGVTTEKKCGDLFCRKAKINVVLWEDGFLAREAKKPTVLGSLTPMVEAKAAEATQVLSTYDPSSKVVYIFAAGGGVPTAGATLTALNVATKKNVTTSIPGGAAYKSHTAVSMAMGPTGGTVVIQYGPYLVQVGIANGSITPVATLWSTTMSPSFQGSPMVGCGNLTHYVTARFSADGNKFGYVVANVANGDVTSSPLVDTSQASSLSWTPLALACVGPKVLALNEGALGIELVFVDTKTTNATHTDLGFTSFAGLGWSAVTNVAVNSPIAFAVDLTPSAPYFIGQYSLSSGQGSSGLWGGIGIPDGTHDTVSGVPIPNAGDIDWFAAPVVVY